MANIAIIGTGYVGLTTGACFASLGHDVICADIDQEKIDKLNSGKIPIVEDGLADLVASGISNGNLKFILGSENAVKFCDVAFLCVPTPQNDDGSANLNYVLDAAKQISKYLPPNSIVVNKSTVPVGSTVLVSNALNRPDVAVVSNPEFLREGSAVSDFFNPDRVVVGCDDFIAADTVADLYSKISPKKILVTDPQSAELIKYASNAFLAVKLSFINSVAEMCENAGCNIDDVSFGMGLDGRIGSQFLKAGPGWGGSCFPKDTRALLHMSKKLDCSFDLLHSAIETNNHQFERIAQKILSMIDSRVTEKIVAVWGLTFKAGTDDLRDSPALSIIENLVQRGVKIVAYDPTVRKNHQANLENLQIADTAVSAIKNAHVLAVLTEWQEFSDIDPSIVASEMSVPVVFDARNILDKNLWVGSGVMYSAIGHQ